MSIPPDIFLKKNSPRLHWNKIKSTWTINEKPLKEVDGLGLIPVVCQMKNSLWYCCIQGEIAKYVEQDHVKEMIRNSIQFMMENQVYMLPNQTTMEPCKNKWSGTRPCWTEMSAPPPCPSEDIKTHLKDARSIVYQPSLWRLFLQLGDQWTY